jgi:clan AA aspartic protease
MISGVVTSRREAVVQIAIRGDSEPLTIEAVVDTGFNDFLTLPLRVIIALGLPFESPAEIKLADSSAATTNYYRGTIEWDGRPREIPILAVEGGALIGMELLAGYNLFIEGVEDGLF